MAQTPDKIGFKIFVALVSPLCVFAVHYCYMSLLLLLNIGHLSAFLLVGVVNLIAVFFLCRLYKININQAKIMQQVKCGLVISVLGLLCLLIACFIVQFCLDISMLDFFRGHRTPNLSPLSLMFYLFIIGVFGPFYEEVLFRGFTLSVLDRLVERQQPFYIVGRLSGVFTFVLAHIVFVGFSYWNILIWTVCGGITTVLYDYFKGYWAGFVVHALANIVIVLLSWRFF